MVTEFAAAIMAGSKDARCCATLRSPEAAAVFRSKGLDPR